MNKTLLIRKGSYNYRAAQNLSRTVSHESGTELKRSKTWTEKTFGEPQDSSMRNAIFTLVATSMETGCLSLPIVLRYAGLLPGIVIILLSGIAAYYGMNGISLAAERRNTFNYSELVHDLLGKNTAMFLDLILVFYLFFSVAGYQLMCNESIISAFKYFDINLQPYMFIIMLSYSLLIVFPMSLLEKVTELKLFSFISIGSIIYICITVLVDFPHYLTENTLSSLQLYKFDLYFFSACTFALFSFTCHMSVATVFSDMNNPSKKRMKKVNFRVCTYQLLIYFVLAIVGYISLLEETPMFITERNAPKSFTSTVQIVISRILVCFVLMVTMPLFMILCRQSIQSLLDLFEPMYLNGFWKAVINLVILVISLVISNYFAEILVIFNFLGAFCAIFSFLLPALLDVASSKYRWNSVQNLAKLIIGVFITLISFISAFLSLILP